MANANSYMDLEHYKYVTVDDTANLCQPGCWLAKVDLKHAYRSVGTHPNSWQVTGMSWCFKDSKHSTYLYNKRLPFGARASPMIFHRLTQSVSCMMAQRGRHSFQSGGATLAFQARIPAELIKRLGDWQSYAYRSFIHIPVKDRMQAVSRLASFV